MLIKITKKLSKSKSKHIAAKLGVDRELGLKILRERLPDAPIANPFLKTTAYELSDDLVKQAHAGNLRAMLKVWRHAECSQDMKNQMQTSFVNALISPPNFPQASNFHFSFSRTFPSDRKNPLSFLRVFSTTDMGDIKKASKSKNWLERAAVCYCKNLPLALVSSLKNDSHEIVRDLAEQLA